MFLLPSTNFKGVMEEKRRRRQAVIASESRIVKQDGNKIPPTQATASQIVEKISAGEWTAVEVLEAFISRACAAQDVSNCLTEIMFNDARSLAKELDEEFARTNQLRGPLHGVPVSFKDLFDIRGYDSTIGYSSYANKPREEDAHLVKIIHAAGGVPFVKTNVPQTMMFFGCSNPLWGTTVSPHHSLFSAGGSSGGEAALLAMDGSALGWGSDVGGSLRIPAAYCGIYSFKPVRGRICKTGVTECLPGFDGVPDVAGPLARSVDDLELACRVTFGHVPDGSDYHHVPVPYRDVQLGKKLRFGYIVYDGFVKTSPACKRAVLQTIEALRRDGHECVEISVPQPSQAMEIMAELTSADGHETLLGPVGSDPIEKELNLELLGPKLYGWMRSSAIWLFRMIMPMETIWHKLFYASRRMSVQEYFASTVKRNEYARLFHEEVWDGHKLDGIICPVQALPQLPQGKCTNLIALPSPTVLWNIVHCPAGVLPVTRVEAEHDAITPEWSDFTVGEGHGSILLEQYLYSKNGYYDPVKMDGLPVGVQVVGRRWEDEKVIAMMKLVDNALGPRGFGPGSWKAQKGV
ncbi:amidase [Wolfiporia cocos MD-104 SS10]|uniref:amidase n=1 Tax=Wolfiporia cocos (strain MD-104) TaxID=742152 RepID=A0A2H3IY56_WOLCO|nr:amidase [Wolfiporia cocos MD-104 SS10]